MNNEMVEIRERQTGSFEQVWWKLLALAPVAGQMVGKKAILFGNSLQQRELIPIVIAL